MQILTDANFLQVTTDHRDAERFHVLLYADGQISHIPKGLFRNNHDEDIENKNFGQFFIGRDSALGVGSIAKYDSHIQSLYVGRHVRGGLRLKFLLNGQHDMKVIAMSMFSGLVYTSPQPQYSDTIIKNDVWIGDEAMILGGAIIENGCVIGARSLIPPNFRTEAYGIYAGNPARLIRFRFSEKIRDNLLAIEWWNQPFEWIKENSSFFQFDLTKNEQESISLIHKLRDRCRITTESKSPV